MKNISCKIVYAIVGGILGIAFSFALVELLADYFMLGEIAMVFMLYVSPFVVILGIVLGTIYARSCKK